MSVSASSPPTPFAPVADASTLNLLALDTSTERLAVALQGRGVQATAVVDGGAQASTQLLPQLARLLGQCGMGWADLDRVAFGRGPGAFTGLRTACSAAQGIAFAHDLPVVPLDSLLIVAEDARLQVVAQAPHAQGTLDVAVAMDARMDEAYAGVYRHTGSGWQVLQAPGLYGLQALRGAWAGLRVDVLAGSALAVWAERMAWPGAAHRHAQEADRGAALLSLALQTAATDAGCDAAQALPLYLRDKVAQTTAERAAAKAAVNPAAATP